MSRKAFNFVCILNSVFKIVMFFLPKQILTVARLKTNYAYYMPKVSQGVKI